MSSTATSGRFIDANSFFLSDIEKLPHQTHTQKQLNKALLALVYSYLKKNSPSPGSVL